jgi:hypothetical protein
MVTNQGTDGATEAQKAFEAARDDVENSAFENKVSSALVERVCACAFSF